MKHYSKSLDMLMAAVQLRRQGKLEKAAVMFDNAARQPDVKITLASLEKLQDASFGRMKAEKATASAVAKIVPVKAKTAAEVMAAFMEAAAAKKVKKKAKAKGKPFGGKQAPPFKKKVKADSDSEIFDKTLDGMSETDASLEGLDDEDYVDELPEATAGEDNGDGESEDDTDMDDASDLDGDDGEDDDVVESESEAEDMDADDLDLDDISLDNDDELDVEESSDDEDDEAEADDESEDEATVSPVVSRVNLIASNINALDRLSKMTAGLVSGTKVLSTPVTKTKPVDKATTASTRLTKVKGLAK